MRKISLGLFFSLALTASVFAEAPLATVNGVSIPQSRMEMVIKEISRNNNSLKIDAQTKDKIKESLITAEVVRQEAEKQGIEKSPAYLARLEQVKEQLLFRTLIDNFFKKHPISEADAKKAYEKIKVSMGGKEYLVRHILLDNETKADEIIADLKKGAKFDELAKTYSKDPGSAKQGGELGWAVPENYTQAFAEVIKKMPKGKISDTPVKTEFGWHIIKVDDIRTTKGPSFAEVKDELIRQMQAEELKKYLDELKAKAKITQ